jgi:hypothetical protein
MSTLLYFRAPRFDISYDSPTAPRLGSIFSNLRRLTAPLNQNELLSVPANLLNKSGTVEFQDTVRKSIEGSVGLVTSAAQGLPGSGDVIYAFARDSCDTYRCAALDTVEFEPDDQFVKDSITASLRVQDALQDSVCFFRSTRVYMITGLKIATGFAKSSITTDEHGPQLKVAVEASSFGVPVTGGCEFGLTFGAGRDVSHGPASSKIVFAYRAIKIWSKRDGQVRYKDLSGGLYSLDDDSEDEEHPSWNAEPVGEEVMLEEFPDAEMVAIRHCAQGR